MFGLRNTKLKSQPGVLNEMDFFRLQKEYVAFCRSHIISEDQAKGDFLRLTHLSWVRRITFKLMVNGGDERCPILILTTECVYLPAYDPEFRHEIGCFDMVFKRSGGAEVCFFNLDGIKYSRSGFQMDHPHVPSDTGIICSDYQPVILSDVAEGRVALAAEMAWVALNTYGSAPYLEREYWARVKIENGHNQGG